MTDSGLYATRLVKIAQPYCDVSVHEKGMPALRLPIDIPDAGRVLRADPTRGAHG